MPGRRARLVALAGVLSWWGLSGTTGAEEKARAGNQTGVFDPELDLVLFRIMVSLRTDPAAAAPKLADVVALARKRGDRKHEWAAQRGTILVHKARGDLKGAEQAARDNLKFARRHREQLDETVTSPATGKKNVVFSRESQSLGDLASVLTTSKRYAEAAANLRAELAILDRIDAAAREGAQAQVEVYERQRDESAASLRQTLTFLDQSSRSLDGLPAEGKAKALADLAATRATIEDALRKGVRSTDQTVATMAASEGLAQNPANQFQAVALGRLGMIQFLTGQLGPAEQTLRAAVGRIRRLGSGMNALGQRPPDYLMAGDLIVNLYRRLAQVLLAEKKTDEALALLELARGRAIARQLGMPLGTDDGLDTQVPDGRSYAKRIGATVVAYSLFSQFDADLLQTSDEDWVPVVQITAAVFTPDGKSTVRTIDLSHEPWNVTGLVRDGRQTLGLRGIGGPQPAVAEGGSPGWLRELHQRLIEPIDDLLPQEPAAPVVVIPQQILFLVPFAALQDANGKPWIESHTLWFEPSLRVAELLRPPPAPGKTSVVVVGNPTMPAVVRARGTPAVAFPPLPGAEREAIAVANLWGTTALLGDRPDRDTVLDRLPAASLIHLATHAFSDDLNGLSGAVVLAPKGKRSPFLTVQDVLMAKTSADLVVLSACDTGRGQLTADGNVGLVSSFLSAGAASVIASQWSVSDQATTFLMSRFYENARGPTPKAAALRTAMLATRAKYPRTRQWAPFVLFGEGQAPARVRVAPDGPGAPVAEPLGCGSLGHRAVPLPIDRARISNLNDMFSRIAPGRRDTVYRVELSRPELVDFYRDVLAPYGFHLSAAAPLILGASSTVGFECATGPALWLGVVGGESSPDTWVHLTWQDQPPPSKN